MLEVNATSYSNVIDYITIASTGNATDFGDLTVARNLSQGVFLLLTRGIFAGEGNQALQMLLII